VSKYRFYSDYCRLAFFFGGLWPALAGFGRFWKALVVFGRFGRFGHFGRFWGFSTSLFLQLYKIDFLQ
jgi:hypothetical protein